MWLAVVDVEALNRGNVESGETCEIAGVGPVSVSAVRALLSDAFLAVVFKKGVDVLNVTHLGRQVTAAQRTAIEARGGCCERCGSTFLLDLDHNVGWTLTHDTCIDDLTHACWHCHDLKTRHKLRFAGPPGNKELVNLDGTRWRGPPDGQPAAPADPVQDDLFGLAT